MDNKEVFEYLNKIAEDLKYSWEMECYYPDSSYNYIFNSIEYRISFTIDPEIVNQTTNTVRVTTVVCDLNNNYFYDYDFVELKNLEKWVLAKMIESVI